MRTEEEHTVYLKDYAPTPYEIHEVALKVEFLGEKARVLAQLKLEPREGTPVGTPLVLDGDELTFRSVTIDGAPLFERDFVATPSSLTIIDPPLKPFVLDTEVFIEPDRNTRLMGLYRSNGVWCTQCEPEGFRRITYYLDRPDVLARFKVTMIADKASAPVLLSNGNLVEVADLDDGRHLAVWEDPHLKPSYLFAMVAGDLGRITDSFTTASGRDVALAIYCEHGKEGQCAYAMDSLKRSMAWDERRFGREYDLDMFNIVAVSDFNFGAMENKGLNIFNDRLVFAQPDSATDADYARIESVIAHEYFHNWTGNRITCRDWFQLCLKEGLTVYRDQEFSMDERSRAVGRIDDVRTLRSVQFPEDASPLAHPPRPDHYKEINNFYTATVYEKGAEVVRMLATLLGEDGFRRGMDLYFSRHDGDATTIEAFLDCFAEATGTSLDQFRGWYLQAGTPEVTVTDSYDPENRRYSLILEQRTRPTPGQPEKQVLTIPVKFGLVGPNGAPLEWSAVSGGTVRDDLILLDTQSATITFEGVANRPVPSLLRGFSAPVKLSGPLSQEDRLFLARHDADSFNRWQALQDVATELQVRALRGEPWAAQRVAALGEALEQTLVATELDPQFKALALALPGEAAIARALGSDIDPDAIHTVRSGLIAALVGQLAPTLSRLHRQLAQGEAYSPDAEQAGIRALRNGALGLLVEGRAQGADALAAEQYETATNMTDRIAALGAAVASWTPDAQRLLDNFRVRFTIDPLVLDKWLSLNGMAPDDGALERIRAILADPTFPKNNPNRLRALMGSLGMNNPTQFARPDGRGFQFVADFVEDVDKRNPQVAARVLTAFRVWPNYEAGRRALAEAALRDLAARGTLSRNTADILERTLAATMA